MKGTSMNDCLNICLCHDICIKNVQLQFLVKCTSIESVRGKGQTKLLFTLYLLFCLFDKLIWIQWIFYIFLSKFLKEFYSWLELVFYSFLSLFQFLFFSPFSWFSGFRCWHMRLIIPGYFSIISVIDSSRIISVIDERLNKLQLVVSVTIFNHLCDLLLHLLSLK